MKNPSAELHPSNAPYSIESESLVIEGDPTPYLDEYRGEDVAPVNTEHPEETPWMLINWPFIHRADDIQEILAQNGIDTKDTFDIDGYTVAARYLYPHSTIDEDDFDTWGWYAVSRLMPQEIGEKGRVLIFPEDLASEAGYESVYQGKLAVRKALGTLACKVVCNGREYVTDFRSCHTPDYENIGSELVVMRDYKSDEVTKRSFVEVILDSNSEASGEFADEPGPLEELFFRAEPTQIPGVFKNKPIEQYPGKPLILALGGASGAGKDTLVNALVESGMATEARAATSRPRRAHAGKEEPFDKYVWMRPQKPSETTDQYRENLIEEYELLECGYHNGNFYGLPKTSLEEAAKDGKVVVVVTDNQGVESIRSAVEGTANCMSVFVSPDHYQDLWNHIQHLDNPDERIEDAKLLTKEARYFFNCFLRNEHIPGGKEKAAQALAELVGAHTSGEIGL